MNAAVQQEPASDLVPAIDTSEVMQVVAKFDRVAAGIAELREKYSGVIYDVTNGAGMAAAKQARLAIREPRYDVEKIRKEAKAPLTSLGKRIDEAAATITTQLRQIEDPIDSQIKAEEDRKERERLARIEAERARVAGIQARIAAIVATPAEMAARDATSISVALGLMRNATIIEEDFAEFTAQAIEARDVTVARLKELHDAAAIREQREAEQAIRQRQLAEQEEQLRAEREEQERTAAAERARIAEEERQARERREAEDRAAREQREREETAARLVRQAEENRIAAERKALDDERARLDAERRAAEVQVELDGKPDPEQPATPVEVAAARPCFAEMVDVLAAHFGAQPVVVMRWLAEDLAAQGFDVQVSA